MKARAKNNVCVLMEDNKFSNFIAGNEYRAMFKGDEVVLIDENKHGFICNKSEFEEDFVIVKE